MTKTQTARTLGQGETVWREGVQRSTETFCDLQRLEALPQVGPTDTPESAVLPALRCSQSSPSHGFCCEACMAIAPVAHFQDSKLQ
jgi:hypothetical protein